MDKEQARFILCSFRPDGADVSDPDFAEALKIAMENRELGEWLARERAFDSTFAKALGSVDLPENLREDIIACLAGERSDFPPVQDSNDAAWIGALASIQPPANMREQLLAAMDRTAAEVVTKPEISLFRRFAVPLAAAAGIALAFLVTRRSEPTVFAKTVGIDAVQAGFVRSYESPFFHLEEKRDNKQVLIRHLQERKLPCPGCLPPGLEKLKSIGCRKLVIDGKSGSLLCFKVGESGVVHVVIFRREDISGDFPPMENPEFVRVGDWTSARWENGKKVFLMMSDTVGDKLPELF
ncbi:MAG: hypothetical protein V4584_07995 [Verrucomicrobiota bacterium]